MDLYSLLLAPALVAAAGGLLAALITPWRPGMFAPARWSALAGLALAGAAVVVHLVTGHPPTDPETGMPPLHFVAEHPAPFVALGLAAAALLLAGLLRRRSESRTVGS